MAFNYQVGDRIAVKFGNNSIEAGDLVTVDTTGNGKAGEAAKPFLGVAAESTASTIKDYISVLTEGVVKVAKASAVATDLGKDVKVKSATSVELSTQNTDIIVGKIVEVVSDSEVLIKLK